MKFKKIIMLSLICLLFMNMQCDDDDVQTTPCGLEIVIDNTTYEEAESHPIESMNIEGDCININIAGSGCDASTWVMTLIDSGNIAESSPNQRYLKLSLYNNEACLAVFTKEESFDLTALRIDGVNEVLLNVEGFEEPILYVY
ncbi:hypothetical protein [Winogradskyella forsetii]|uniref:hypothetical protein n=1 Tax=Winogradskyella forsetii TaxID=2686077 RepID=UPI0015B8C46A|nr:hypothetical protein [Winogradskyella forsetii]